MAAVEVARTPVTRLKAESRMRVGLRNMNASSAKHCASIAGQRRREEEKSSVAMFSRVGVGLRMEPWIAALRNRFSAGQGFSLALAAESPTVLSPDRMQPRS